MLNPYPYYIYLLILLPAPPSLVSAFLYILFLFKNDPWSTVCAVHIMGLGPPTSICSTRWASPLKTMDSPFPRSHRLFLEKLKYSYIISLASSSLFRIYAYNLRSLFSAVCMYILSGLTSLYWITNWSFSLEEDSFSQFPLSVPFSWLLFFV